jgi:TPR repeat protein
MRNLTATLCLTLAVFLGSAGVSWSAETLYTDNCRASWKCLAALQKGLTAYESGDYATALRELEPLAEQGNERAQNNLGVMYAFGQGVLKDYVYAHM